jgi:hypothetical protein
MEESIDLSQVRGENQNEAIEGQRAQSIPEPWTGFQARVFAVPISVLLLGFVLFCYT